MEANKTAQTLALTSFRGALDLLCAALEAQGIPPAEIAEILGMQAVSLLEVDCPLTAEIFARAADRLPTPRDLAA